jgi:hypothetical protein
MDVPEAGRDRTGPRHEDRGRGDPRQDVAASGAAPPRLAELSLPRGRSLQQAASAVFALIAVLPMLTFAYTLYTIDAIEKFQYQLSLILALTVAIAGFVLFRMLMRRMSMLLRVVGEAARRGEVLEMPAATSLQIPGIGPIEEFQELGELVQHLGELWKAEAERYVGQRVALLQRGLSHATRGTLIEAAPDGVILAVTGGQLAISYRRIMAIEEDRQGA